MPTDNISVTSENSLPNEEDSMSAHSEIDGVGLTQNFLEVTSNRQESQGDSSDD